MTNFLEKTKTATTASKNEPFSLLSSLLFFASAYCVQGIIKGFVTIAFVSYMLENQVSDLGMGLFTGLYYLPWCLKVVWAPLVDLYAKYSWGKHSYLVTAAHLGIAGGLVLISSVSDPIHSILFVVAVLLGIDILVSIQDVTVDSLAIRNLSDDKLPIANGGMQFGRMGGIAVGASLSAIGLSTLGFRNTIGLILVAVIGLTFLTVLPGLKLEKFFNNAHLSNPVEVRHSFFSRLIACSKKLLSESRIVLIGLFGFAASMAESILTFVEKPFFIKELNWSSSEFSTANTFGFAAQAIVALIVGVVVLKTKHIHRNCFFGFLFSGSLFIAAGITFSCKAINPMAYLIVCPAASKIGWVCYLAIAMKLSKGEFAATTFTVLVTLCNLGSSLGAALASPIRGQLELDYPAMIVLGGGLTIVSCVLLRFSEGDKETPAFSKYE